MQLQFIQKYSRNLNLDKVRSVRTNNFDNREDVAKIFIQMTFDQVGNLPFWCSGLYSWTFFRFITFIRICFMGIIVLLIESMFCYCSLEWERKKQSILAVFLQHYKKITQVYQVRLRYIFRYLRDFMISYFNPNPPVPVSLPLHSVSLHTNENQRQKIHKHVAYSS